MYFSGDFYDIILAPFVREFICSSVHPQIHLSHHSVAFSLNSLDWGLQIPPISVYHLNVSWWYKHDSSVCPSIHTTAHPFNRSFLVRGIKENKNFRLDLDCSTTSLLVCRSWKIYVYCQTAVAALDGTEINVGKQTRHSWRAYNWLYLPQYIGIRDGWVRR